MKPKFISLLPAIVWFCLIFILLVLPSRDLPREDFLSGIYFDKWVHAGLFGGLVFLFSYPFLKTYPTKSNFYILVVVFAIMYGVAMEFVQRCCTVGRDFDVNDMIADAIGAVLGYVFLRIVCRKVAEKNKPL